MRRPSSVAARKMRMAISPRLSASSFFMGNGFLFLKVSIGHQLGKQVRPAVRHRIVSDRRPRAVVVNLNGFGLL